MTYLSAAGTFLAQQLKMLIKIPSTKKLLEKMIASNKKHYQTILYFAKKYFSGWKSGMQWIVYVKRKRVVVADLLATLRTIGRNAISAAELAFSRSLDS